MKVETINNNTIYSIYCSNCKTQVTSQTEPNEFPYYKIKDNTEIDLKYHKKKNIDLTIRLSKKEIELIDNQSKTTVNYITFDKIIESITVLPLGPAEYHITFSDQSCQHLSLKQFGLVCEALTNGEYILNIDMQEKNRGFYFGLYEIGEFELINQKTIKILRSYKTHYTDKGWTIKNDFVILSHREGIDSDTEVAKYSILGLNWTNKSPEKSWELSSLSSLNSLLQLNEDKIFFGYLNGYFDIFSIKQKKVIKSIELFNSGFSYMCLKGNRVYCSSLKGELACITLEGKIIWKQTTDGSTIHNIEIKNGQLHLITSQKIYYIVNPENGDILTKNPFTFKEPSMFSSNFVFFKDWTIISGQAHLIHIHKTDNIFFISADDPLIRVLRLHPEGYFTGDDDGKIKFWKYTNVILSKIFTNL